MEFVTIRIALADFAVSHVRIEARTIEIAKHRVQILLKLY